ncbi:MAG TPA: 23S rRNA (pseudouridine(1915)-N(3))-methyltransferase RlmH [Gammaproteobacteria bacterium]
MRIYLVAVGQRMDAWVSQGYLEFSKRLPPECRLQLIEVPPNKRTKNTDTQRAINEEGERLLAALPANAIVYAMDAAGQPWSTQQLAAHLGQWLGDGRDVALLVGGPDGLSEHCKARAHACWSLSRLTFPHPLVRIIIAEQVYRAWSILKGHPYHR